MPRLIKKHDNRRLFDVTSRTYVKLTDVAKLVEGGEEVLVVTVKAEEDVTAAVLLDALKERHAGLKDSPYDSRVLHLMLREAKRTVNRLKAGL